MNRNLLIIISFLFIVILVYAVILFKNDDISTTNNTKYDSELELLKEENKDKYERYKEIEEWNQEIINYLD